MKNSKPFGALGTALRHNVFVQARVRLTLFYLAILVIILFLFSQAIYVGFNGNVRARARRYARTPVEQLRFVQESQEEFTQTLLLINAAILVISGGLAYFLAGKTLSPIQKTLEEQKRFLSDASHELRTPLAILKTSMQVHLAQKNVSKEYAQNLGEYLIEVNHMSSLVNDLLLLSRLDDNKSAAFESLNISQLLEQICNRMKKYAQSKLVKISLGSWQDEMFVRGNRDMLLSAFSNIVKNAIDYNKKKGSVMITAEKTDGHVEISIKDTGMGVEQDQMKNIFDRFYRIEKSRGGEVSGTGLGLSIAKMVVQNHNGSITMESVLGKGSTIIVRLPLVNPS